MNSPFDYEIKTRKDALHIIGAHNHGLGYMYATEFGIMWTISYPPTTEHLTILIPNDILSSELKDICREMWEEAGIVMILRDLTVKQLFLELSKEEEG